MGFLDRLNDNGVDAPFNSGQKNDATDVYGNLNQMRIEFYHLPSDKSVSFKAYITEWSDNFSSKYNSEEVFGRNDQIHTFQGTDREISLSWDVVASSVKEGQENLGRISLLAQFLYPAYKMQSMGFQGQLMQVGTMTKAPLIKVRFANLIVDSKSGLDNVNAKNSGLLAALDGLQIAADLDAGVFDGAALATPKVFKLTTKLKVLHQHTLGWDNDRKAWLGEGGAQGYPYNAWGAGQSSSNTIARAGARGATGAMANALNDSGGGYGVLDPDRVEANALPDASGAEAPQLSEEEAAEVNGALGVEETANPSIENETPPRIGDYDPFGAADANPYSS